MNEDDTDDSIADAVSSANTPRRFRVEGSINQAYTDILAHQLCRKNVILSKAATVIFKVNLFTKLTPSRC